MATGTGCGCATGSGNMHMHAHACTCMHKPDCGLWRRCRQILCTKWKHSNWLIPLWSDLIWSDNANTQTVCGTVRWWGLKLPHCVTGNCNELRRKERPRKVKRVKCDSIHSFILSFFGSLILPPFSSCGSCENPISHIRLSGCGPERTQGCRSGHTQDAQVWVRVGPRWQTWMWHASSVVGPSSSPVACILCPVDSQCLCAAIYRNYSLFRQYYGSFGLCSTNRWQIARHFLINFNSSINPQRTSAESSQTCRLSCHVCRKFQREGERGGARWAAAKENFFYFENWPETYK